MVYHIKPESNLKDNLIFVSLFNRQPSSSLTEINIFVSSGVTLEEYITQLFFYYSSLTIPLFHFLYPKRLSHSLSLSLFLPSLFSLFLFSCSFPSVYGLVDGERGSSLTCELRLQYIQCRCHSSNILLNYPNYIFRLESLRFN